MTYAYDIREILSALAAGPEQAIAAWEEDYRRQIQTVAEFVAENRRKSPVVLLAGPSASSKTSTATRIRSALWDMDVPAHLLSMDDYFIGMDTEGFPRLPDGKPDLESPECLDMALLDEHFSRLEQGQDIYVPRYDFLTQRRADGPGLYLDIEPGDVFIFEGIHALNHRFTSRHPSACRIYVSPEAVFQKDGDVFCTPVQLRLMRRMVRDFQFRGASAEYSLGLWGNVIDGESKYILPYQAAANCQVVTALPYELGVLKKFVSPLLGDLPEDVPCQGEVDRIRVLLEEIPVLSAALVPDDSIVREFIGPRPEPGED